MDTRREASRALLQGFFTKLGYDTALADIYLALYAEGSQSIAGLSRTSQVERTRIYRLIDQLLETQLVTIQGSGSRSQLKAAPLSQIRVLLAERAQAVANLQDELTALEQTLSYATLEAPGMVATLHSGNDGLRQVLTSLAASGADIYRYEQRPRLNLLLPADRADWLASWQTGSARMHTLQAEHPLTPAKNGTIQRQEARQADHDLDLDLCGDLIVRYYYQAGQAYALTLRDAPLAATLQTQFTAAWSAAGSII